MPPTLHTRIGVSTWSLNKSLMAGTPLLDIPAQVAAHGLSKLEVCHFHFPSVEAEYLVEFRAALDGAGVEFYTLLIDEGDLTHPDVSERENAVAFMKHWIDVAAQAGASRVRVIAGDATFSEETLNVSVSGLTEVLDHADAHGVHVVTENWHRLLDHPDAVLALMGRMQGRLGLKLDFGNWPTERKYVDLPKIAPLAECTHAKASFVTAGDMEKEEFTRCLDVCRDAGFSGPHVLIFSDPGDEWNSLDEMAEVVRDYVERH